MAVVSFEAALEITLREAASLRPESTEVLPLLRTAGRVLATSLVADRDQPPFDRSTRDGFAVIAQDASTGHPLRIVGQVAAGQLWQGTALAVGEAIQIMTGAPVPPGADSVVMIEHVIRLGSAAAGSVQMQQDRKLSPGDNIVPRGQEARRGAQLVAAGTRIGAAEIALAAACGAATLEVYGRPDVAIVATGDELVELDQAPGPQQIRNSNSYAIAAMVGHAGGHPLQLAIARDRREELHERISEGRHADLLLLSGGVSMGEYDLVEAVLAELGAEFIFTGVTMQPGRPVVFGRLPAGHHGAARFFFGLPGNPISTQVTFHCFVEPFLRVLGGEIPSGPRFIQGTLSAGVEAGPGLTRMLPARREGIGVRVVGWQGSGDLAANARANCYAELLPGREYHVGDVIRILER